MKKGFTLIELLAVIVILGVLALIITPVINNVIENSRKAAYKESVNNIISSASNYVAEYLIKHSSSELPYPMVFICDGVSCLNQDNEILNFSGDIPISGTITLKSEDLIYAEYVTNGKYCATGYKGHIEVGSTCADVDVTRPTILGTLNGKKIILTLIDNESGISGYCVTTTDDATTCDWISAEEGAVEYTLTNPGTYYAFAKDKKENVSNSINFTAEAAAFCQVARNTRTAFGYNGGVQTYDVPCDGLYKLEARGGNGGNVGQRYEWYNGQHVASWINDAYGGAGGTTIGYVMLHEGDKLYIAVGGQGGTSDSSHEDGPGGGFNGGGHAMHQGDNGGETGAGGGGGCTHFALNSNRGVLSAYASNRNEILIVAGGGGGAAHGNGGAGNNQSANGAFGQGGDEPFNYHGGNNAGGGCGWAGGAKAYWPSAYGGSGYIGGVSASITFKDQTYTSSITAGGGSGHGSAAVTLVDY